MGRTTRRSVCNRDCPDACGLVATVEDGRIVSLAGDPQHPVTRGFLCYRTSHYPKIMGSSRRLRTPLLRRNGELVPVSLNEALDVVAERLQSVRATSGPEAIFHYRSGGSLGLLKALADRFFEQFGPCTVKSGDICSGAGEAAQVADFGVSDSNDLFDLRHSRHVVIWGKNPFVSNVHLVPLLKELRAAGTTLTSIDPVHHRGARLADHDLRPRPGGDAALALGVLRALADTDGLDPAAGSRCRGFDDLLAVVRSRSFEDWARAADLPAADVAALAARFAAGPTAILVGWGLQRRAFGATTVRLLDALAAVSGNLFVRGGGCSFYFKRRGPFANDAVSTGRAARFVREPLFADDVLAMRDPPIRAMWITAGNPVCMLPDSARVAEAIDRTEFVVVVDPLLTDTARRADVVLPVPTFLEDSDLLGSYGHHWIGESRPLVEPPPDVPHEVDLFRALAERVGLGEALAGSVDDWKRRLLARVEPEGVTLESLRDAGPVRNPFAGDQLFGDDGRVATDDGRVHLVTEIDAGAIESPLAESAFPLWLFSNSTEKAQASQWPNEPAAMTVTVHPDAAPDGAGDGDAVVVESELGRLDAVLRLDDAQRPDVAIVPKGGAFDRGQSVNGLIAARPTDHGLGAAYLDCRVRLTRAAEAKASP